MAMPLGTLSTFSVAAAPSLSKSPSSSFIFLQPASFRPSFNVKLKTSVTHATASEPVTETKKRAPRGFSKPRPVSPEMMEFLGGRTEIPRTEVLKVIWAHIKENDLQVVDYIHLFSFRLLQFVLMLTVAMKPQLASSIH